MRPKVIVNCAMSADGKIAGRDRRQLRISTDEDMERVKRLRRDSDAIMVGVGTVLADDPHLTVKGLPPGEGPLRAVVDSNGRTPADAKVLDSRAGTLIFHAEGASPPSDAEAFACGRGRVDLKAAMEELGRRGVATVMVEGGGELIASLFEEGLVDEYLVFVGPLIIGGGGAPSPVDGEGRDGEKALGLRFIGHEQLGDGVLLRYAVDRRP